MKKNLVISFILCFFAGSVLSQDTKDSTYLDTAKTEFKNAVKVNVAAAAFKNFSLYYGRQINKHWDVLLGAGYKFKGKIPEIFSISNVVITSSTQGVKGFSITPEVRYNFWSKKWGEASGLYLGAYGRITKYYGDIAFNYWNGTDYIDVGGAGSMREFGLGLQLGYQFKLGERFLVDMMFMGPRTSFHRLKVELDSQFASDVLPLIEEEINKKLAWWGMDPISIPTDASAVVDFRFNNFRYAVGIGYLF